MSNVLSIRPSDLKELKKQFLELTASGNIEARVLDLLQIERWQFMKMCHEDANFVKEIEEARRSRAEFWVSKIAHDIDVLPEANAVAAEKYRLEKLIFLAKADNPERYGTGKTKVDISLDLKQFRLVTPEQAVKALAADPFAIEAECTPIEEEELL